MSPASGPPDMEVVWAKIQQIATTGYLQENRINELEDRLLRMEEDMLEWFSRVTPITEDNANQLVQLRILIERYLRGLGNGKQSQ